MIGSVITDRYKIETELGTSHILRQSLRLAQDDAQESPCGWEMTLPLVRKTQHQDVPSHQAGEYQDLQITSLKNFGIA